MSNEQPLGGAEPVSWQPPDASTIGMGVGTQMTMPTGSPGPGSPKKRWPYVVLIAVSLTLVAVSGTLIALSLEGKGDKVTTNSEEATPKPKQPTTDRDGSGEEADRTSEDATRDAEADDTSVTLAERTSPPAGVDNGADQASPAASDDANPESEAAIGDYTLGIISFDVPSGFTPTVVAERRDDGALRSEFQGPGGQQVVVEFNPDGATDGLATAQELAGTFRDQGRLLREPYADQVEGKSTGVLAIRGSEGDFRSDHFFVYDGNGMAVMGIDLSSLDAADSLARSVIPTISS